MKMPLPFVFYKLPRNTRFRDLVQFRISYTYRILASTQETRMYGRAKLDSGVLTEFLVAEDTADHE